MLHTISILGLAFCLSTSLRAQTVLRDSLSFSNRVATASGRARLDSARTIRQYVIHDATVGAIAGAIAGAVAAWAITTPTKSCQPDPARVCGQGSSRGAVVVLVGLEGAAVGAIVGAVVGWTRSSHP